MGKKYKRERVCNLCLTCINDCKLKKNIKECINFKKGFSTFEYWELIKDQNINLRKLCDKKGLKLNMMLDMLNDKKHLTYKYRYFLDDRIFEKEEYLKYIEKFSEVIYG